MTPSPRSIPAMCVPSPSRARRSASGSCEARCPATSPPRFAQPIKSSPPNTARAPTSRCAPRPQPRICRAPPSRGQQETFLNIRGTDNLLTTCKRVIASLFTDRAISYRVDKGIDHMSVALSIGVQKMVRADLGAAGVKFTLDTETGFRDVVFINAAYGLGESVVQGSVNPDEFYVFKTTLASG